MSNCGALHGVERLAIEQPHVNFVVLLIKMIKALTCGPIYMKHNLVVSIRQL